VNYFAHAIRFLDRPWFMAGTAIPDWLNVVDRKCRVRRKNVLAGLPELSGVERDVALGIVQHLDDDQWFHVTPAFFECTNDLAVAFRSHLGPDDAWHCGFLGHIVLELLLDAELIRRNPDLLEQYYTAFQAIDPRMVADVVSRLATIPAPGLSQLIPLYVEERFLADYLDDRRLLHRLNQVMRRVKLPALPGSTVDVLAWSRELVAVQSPQLLPENHFLPAGALPDAAPSSEKGCTGANAPELRGT